MVGSDAEMFACGPSCDGVHAYAYFFGREAEYKIVDIAPNRKRRVLTREAEFMFTCPDPLRPMDIEDWKCGRFIENKGLTRG